MEWLREARPRGSAAGGRPGGGNTRGGERRPGTVEGVPEYWDRAGTGALGCWPGPRSLERGAERGVGGGDGRVRLRRGRGGQGGPRRDLPVPGAAFPGRPPESLLSISRGPSCSSPSKASSLPPPPHPLAVSAAVALGLPAL